MTEQEYLDTPEQIKNDLSVASNIVFNAASAESPQIAHAYRRISERLDRYARYAQVKTIAAPSHPEPSAVDWGREFEALAQREPSAARPTTNVSATSSSLGESASGGLPEGLAAWLARKRERKAHALGSLGPHEIYALYLADENARLVEALEEKEQRFSALKEAARQLSLTNAAFEDRVKELEASLAQHAQDLEHAKEYAECKAWCNTGMGPGRVCNCGNPRYPTPQET